MGITHLFCSTIVVCVSLPEKKVVVDDRFIRDGQFLISGVWNEELIGQGGYRRSRYTNSLTWKVKTLNWVDLSLDHAQLMKAWVFRFVLMLRFCRWSLCGAATSTCITMLECIYLKGECKLTVSFESCPLFIAMMSHASARGLRTSCWTSCVFPI